MYLLHRYQTEAAAKEIGGLDFRYAVRGDGQMVTKMVPGDQQRKALAAVLKTLDPANLTIPESILQNFPPRPPEYPRTRESFTGAHTGPTFDALGAVESAAEITANVCSIPTGRPGWSMSRSRASLPGLTEVLDATLKATWYAPRQQGLARETQFTVETVVLDHLLSMAASPTIGSQARAIAESEIEALEIAFRSNEPGCKRPDLRAHLAAGIEEISRFERTPSSFQPAKEAPEPPGAPIGGGN